MESIILCPNCGEETYFCFDEWGYTPFHLHCKKCEINIGATSIQKCKELLVDHHKPQTYIEYYNGEIQLLFEEGRRVINNEDN